MTCITFQIPGIAHPGMKILTILLTSWVISTAGQEVCSVGKQNIALNSPCCSPTESRCEALLDGNVDVIHTTIACSGTPMEINCDQHEGETIQIIDANFGRTDRTTCAICYTCNLTPQLYGNDCWAQDSKKIVAERCDYKTGCSVPASKPVFGDPCYGTYKYLDVQYRCSKTWQPPMEWVYIQLTGEYQIDCVEIYTSCKSTTAPAFQSEVLFQYTNQSITDTQLVSPCSGGPAYFQINDVSTNSIKILTSSLDFSFDEIKLYGIPQPRADPADGCFRVKTEDGSHSYTLGPAEYTAQRNCIVDCVANPNCVATKVNRKTGECFQIHDDCLLERLNLQEWIGWTQED